MARKDRSVEGEGVMNTTVEDAIADSIADLEQVSSFPVAPFGYGGDLWCESDLDARMNEVSDSALVIAQMCVRRLDTPSGLPDDDDWGISISEYCNRPTDRAELYNLEGEIVTELSDDDRIEEVKASVQPSSDYTTLTVEIRVVPAEYRDEAFTMTLTASDSGVLVEEIR